VDYADLPALVDVVDMLCREYASELSRATVTDIVQAAHRDLQGQVRPEARVEMAYQLARQRLGG
jgi:hypothetical protein